MLHCGRLGRHDLKKYFSTFSTRIWTHNLLLPKPVGMMITKSRLRHLESGSDLPTQRLHKKLQNRPLFFKFNYPIKSYSIFCIPESMELFTLCEKQHNRISPILKLFCNTCLYRQYQTFWYCTYGEHNSLPIGPFLLKKSSLFWQYFPIKILLFSWILKYERQEAGTIFILSTIATTSIEESP